MRLSVLSAVAAVAVGVVPAVAVPAVPAAAAEPGLAVADPAPAASWRSVPLPPTVTEPAALYSVSAVSPWSAWAAGAEAIGTNPRPLILHWNGLRWVQEPVAGVPVFEVTAISSVSPGHAWALGQAFGGAAHILRWSLGAWRDVPLPPDLAAGLVYAVGAGPLGTAWVWGYSNQLGYLLEHWDGSAWHTITVPYADWGVLTVLRAAGNGVWAAGMTVTGTAQVLHWDGGSWSQITGPPGSESYDDVLAAGPADVWAAGNYCVSIALPFGCTSGALITHWNGTSWDTVVDQPAYADATTISADQSGRPQWAGLSAFTTPGVIAYDHFDGVTWTPVTAPRPDASIAVSQTAHIPGTGATWAVGYVSSGSTATAFIQLNPGT